MKVRRVIPATIAIVLFVSVCGAAGYFLGVDGIYGWVGAVIVVGIESALLMATILTFVVIRVDGEGLLPRSWLDSLNRWAGERERKRLRRSAAVYSRLSRTFRKWSNNARRLARALNERAASLEDQS